AATMVEWPVGSGQQRRLAELCREHGISIFTVKSRLKAGRPWPQALTDKPCCGLAGGVRKGKPKEPKVHAPAPPHVNGISVPTVDELAAADPRPPFPTARVAGVPPKPARAPFLLPAENVMAGLGRARGRLAVWGGAR